MQRCRINFGLTGNFQIKLNREEKNALFPFPDE